MSCITRLTDVVELTDSTLIDLTSHTSSSIADWKALVTSSTKIDWTTDWALGNWTKDTLATVRRRIVVVDACGTNIIGIALNTVLHETDVALTYEGSESCYTRLAIILCITGSTVWNITTDAGFGIKGKGKPCFAVGAQASWRTESTLGDVAVNAVSVI